MLTTGTKPFAVLQCCALVLLLACGPAAEPQPAVPVRQAGADSSYIRNAFAIADEAVSKGNYDTAQQWLNRIHEKISYRSPSLFSYFLTVRQAEVYYYNNLHQLGLQEARRALRMAETLQDPILEADAYNFCGLFLTNIDRVDTAIACFKKGIALCSQPPYPAGYFELSNPHHLYGNLSEAFEKQGEEDSAIYYGRLSLQKAQEIRHSRGMATAALNLASSFLRKEIADSAQYYFEASRTQAIRSNDFDIELNADGSLAVCALLKKDQPKALGLIAAGFRLLEQRPQLNHFYALIFLDQAANVYRQCGEYAALAKALEMKSAIQEVTHEKNNQQYRTVLTTALQNETRILNLDIAKARQEKSLATTRLYVVGLVFLVVVAIFVAYRYYTLQKLRLANLRNKISQDLHDEVGATLSGIALYSYITREQSSRQAQEEVAHSLGIIEKNATGMVQQLNDIVWAVNPVHDSLQSLVQRLEEFAVETAAAKNIRIQLLREQEGQDPRLSMDARRNIYLICKEAVNNAIKYSNCTTISIRTALYRDRLQVTIADDGAGFVQAQAPKGNGLVNMQARAKELDARLEIHSEAGKGTTIALDCRITR